MVTRCAMLNNNPKYTDIWNKIHIATSGLYLSQLYYNVHQIQDFLLIQMSSSVIKQVRNRDFVFYGFIKCLLPGAQGARNNNFFLICHLRDDILLDSSKHKGLQNWVLQNCNKFLEILLTFYFLMTLGQGHEWSILYSSQIWVGHW